jgi:hypothetical protein
MASSVNRSTPVNASVAQVNLDRWIPSIRNSISQFNFSKHAKIAANLADSAPFVNICLVSLKNAPYIFYGNNAFVAELENGISCRLRSFEAALMGAASLVYNFVFATFFSVVSLVTLGQVKLLVEQMNKLWIHTALAATAVFVGLIGTISPGYGVKASAFALGVIAITLFKWLESDLVRNVCQAYRNNRSQIASALQTSAGSTIYYDRIRPILERLDRELNNNSNVQTLADLYALGQRADISISAGMEGVSVNGISIYVSPAVLVQTAADMFNEMIQPLRQVATQSVGN